MKKRALHQFMKRQDKWCRLMWHFQDVSKKSAPASTHANGGGELRERRALPMPRFCERRGVTGRRDDPVLAWEIAASGDDQRTCWIAGGFDDLPRGSSSRLKADHRERVVDVSSSEVGQRMQKCEPKFQLMSSGSTVLRHPSIPSDDLAGRWVPLRVRNR